MQYCKQDFSYKYLDHFIVHILFTAKLYTLAIIFKPYLLSFLAPREYFRFRLWAKLCCVTMIILYYILYCIKSIHYYTSAYLKRSLLHNSEMFRVQIRSTVSICGVLLITSENQLTFINLTIKIGTLLNRIFISKLFKTNAGSTVILWLNVFI